MISISSLSGYKFRTTFTTQLSPSSTDPIVSWGDNTFSYTSTASHIFSAHGIFRVSVSNCLETSAFSLSVLRGEFFENNINVSYTTPLSAYAGCPKTFNIAVSSITPSATIFLYASGSNSVPYITPRTFWSHLNPEWEFRNIANKPISELTMLGTAVYNASSQLLGYSALSTVNFVDDMPGNPILFFTMKTYESVIPTNSRIYSALSYSVSSQIPKNLQITADGINAINLTQWADVNMPYTITVHGEQCDSIVYNASGYLTQIDILQNCFGINSDNYNRFLSAINPTDSNCRPTGGYSINNLFLSSSFLSADTLFNNYSTNPCDPNIEDIEYYKQRTSPINIVLSAHGIFNVNGIIYSLSGTSAPFNIYPLTNIHKYYKKGEEKTTYDILNRYSHFDLSQLPNLDNYLKVITGEDGLDFYGKTQNFAKDHADIDICSVRSLYDIAAKKAMNVDNFGISFPLDIEKFINDFSVPLAKLIGTRCVCNTNFNCQNCCGKNICTVCCFDKKNNLGKPLTSSSPVTADQILIIREDRSEIYEFYNVTQNTNIINLTGHPFDEKSIDKFCFFEWNQTHQNNPVESVINYRDPRNLLNSSLSSIDEWYSDNGVIEEVFNYLLTKNILDE